MGGRRVVVIGAGTAGLCAAKNAIENGLEVVVYEQRNLLGGLWNYTNDTGVDENDVPYGYMYRDLKTNVPKELMRFTDFDVKMENKWFLNSEEVVQFLRSYAKEFELEPLIWYHRQVVRVIPKGEKKWEVLVKDLRNNSYFTEIFDYVMVCNGHHFHPSWPNIKGRELFHGIQKHSFDFRFKEEFQDKRVLVVGSGPSALDIAVLLSNCASIVTLAHHIPLRASAALSESVVLKPDVEEFTETGAIFKDGSDCQVDAILFCTGFKFAFPFLSTECGVFVEDNYVQPLFKQVINIRHTTMAFIGLNFLVAAQMHFDIQAQFAVRMWTSTNARPFPRIEEMMMDAEVDLAKRLNRGWKRRHGHRMGDLVADYYRQLTEFAPDIRGMSSVYLKIFQTVGLGIITNYLNYRNDRYHVINDETFEKSSACETEK